MRRPTIAQVATRPYIRNVSVMRCAVIALSPKAS